MSQAIAAPSLQRQPVLGLPDPGERVPPLAWPTVALWLGTLALFGAELYGVLVGAWSPWLTVPMGAAVTFLMFSVLHEATHHAVSSNTRVNNAFGHLSVHFVATYGNFPLLKFIHIEHHRNTNEPKLVDPDHWTSEGPWWQLPFRWLTLDLWYLVFYLRRIRERPLVEAVPTVAWFATAVAGFVWLGTQGFGVEVLTLLAGQRIGIGILAWWFDYLPHHGLTFTQRQDKYQATRVRVGGEWWMTRSSSTRTTTSSITCTRACPSTATSSPGGATSRPIWTGTPPSRRGSAGRSHRPSTAPGVGSLTTTG